MNMIYEENGRKLYLGDCEDAVNVDPESVTVIDVRGRIFFLGPDKKTNAKVKKDNLHECNIIAFEIDDAMNSGKDVLVHCGVGIERSPLVVTFWLYKNTDMGWDKAYKHVRDRHPPTMYRDELLPE
jgi:hypothetical protein